MGGTVHFEERGLASSVFRWQGSVAPRALWFALPAACLSSVLLVLGDVSPNWREPVGVFGAGASSVLWSSTTACVMFLVGFRSRQALGRFWEGTGLLHQMRGEWFDAASCLMTFSRGARTAKPKEVAEFRHTLIRLMSMLHGSALEEIKATHKNVYKVIDLCGLDRETRNYLRDCKKKHGFNRVEVLIHMVQVLVMQALDDGTLKVAPPILTRVYQTLSRGLVNLLNARKITDTKFPFPYVQLTSTLLIFHAVLTPLVITEIIQHKVWAALFTFIPVFGLFSLNLIAIELECPFGDDPNDLPLERFQHEMNSSLIMLLSDESDRLVRMSPSAILHFGDLTQGIARPQLDRTSSADMLKMASRSWHVVPWLQDEPKDEPRSMFDFEDEQASCAEDSTGKASAELMQSEQFAPGLEKVLEASCDHGRAPFTSELASSGGADLVERSKEGPLPHAGQASSSGHTSRSCSLAANVGWDTSSLLVGGSATERRTADSASATEDLRRITEAVRSLAAALPQIGATSGEHLFIDVESHGEATALGMFRAPPRYPLRCSM